MADHHIEKNVDSYTRNEKLKKQGTLLYHMSSFEKHTFFPKQTDTIFHQ